MPRWIWLAALLLTAGAAVPCRCAAADAAALRLEYKVKGGYLFHFVKLVEWPIAAMPASGKPFIIGVIDDGEALPAIQAQLAGKVIDGHPLQVQMIDADRIGSGVHVLFVTRKAKKSADEILAALHGSTTLLVGETDDFAQRGGSLNFFVMDGSVKFEANPDAAARAHLNLGSQLLKLARIVRDIPEEKM